MVRQHRPSPTVARHPPNNSHSSISMAIATAIAVVTWGRSEK